MPAIYLAYSHF